MFFPKLRRQAKWMFVFLALAFGIGFVAFGIGGDRRQRASATSSSDPTARAAARRSSDARDKIEDGNLAAYKDAVRGLPEPRTSRTRRSQPASSYLKVRPKDYDFIRTLASDYEGKATRLREEAAVVQAELTATTGGTTFGLPQNTLLGRALGQGKIDQELTTAANQKLTELLLGHPDGVHARDAALPAGRRSRSPTTRSCSSCSPSRHTRRS